MSKYSTIKQLVLEMYAVEGEMPPFEQLTKLVSEHFPESKWQKSHYSYYKSHIKTGKLNPITGRTEINSLSEDIEEDISASANVGISVERDLQNYLFHNLDVIESDLTLVDGGIEYSIDAGRIDLLAQNSNNELVVIEIKAGTASDSALGQLLGYMGCLSETDTTSQKIRGVLVAHEFSSRTIYAAKALPNIKLLQYQLKFNLDEVNDIQ